ncbi:UNVERIFIED_CONTAM: hypothetical protein NCL1_41719 [Trichonephila clavipes]
MESSKRFPYFKNSWSCCMCIDRQNMRFKSNKNSASQEANKQQEKNEAASTSGSSSTFCSTKTVSKIKAEGNKDTENVSLNVTEEDELLFKKVQEIAEQLSKLLKITYSETRFYCIHCLSMRQIDEGCGAI